LLSQAFRLPAGRPAHAGPAERFGAVASFRNSGAEASLAISSRRFLYGVHVEVPGFSAREQGFSVEPGHERVVELVGREPGAEFARGAVNALNVRGRIAVQREGGAREGGA
jgi:hypothetical protein